MLYQYPVDLARLYFVALWLGLGIRKDCRQSLITMLSPKTPIPNLFLTGQSLVLHGLEGVTMTAFKTLETIKNEKL
jgi:hypothetical protein